MKRVVALSLMVFLAVLLSACAGSESTDQSVVSQNSEIIREEEPVSQENNLQESEESEDVAQGAAKLLYMGQASIRITTAEGKVIYIDPYVGDGYEPAAEYITWILMKLLNALDWCRQGTIPLSCYRTARCVFRPGKSGTV